MNRPNCQQCLAKATELKEAVQKELLDVLLLVAVQISSSTDLNRVNGKF